MCAQVCQLQWSRHEREILSAHGFSQNQLCLWKYPSMVKMGELSGHTSRVLHLTQSPDGTTLVSGAADETLRFWRIFGDSQDKSSKVRLFAGLAACPTCCICSSCQHADRTLPAAAVLQADRNV